MFMHIWMFCYTNCCKMTFVNCKGSVEGETSCALKYEYLIHGQLYGMEISDTQFEMRA